MLIFPRLLATNEALKLSAEYGLGKPLAAGRGYKDHDKYDDVKRDKHACPDVTGIDSDVTGIVCANHRDKCCDGFVYGVEAQATVCAVAAEKAAAAAAAAAAEAAEAAAAVVAELEEDAAAAADTAAAEMMRLKMQAAVAAAEVGRYKLNAVDPWRLTSNLELEK